MSKINMFKMDVWTIWSQSSSCYAFYIEPNCFRNLHTKFGNDKTIFQPELINLKKNSYA